jgi:hypothetical protein
MQHHLVLLVVTESMDIAQRRRHRQSMGGRPPEKLP